MILISSVVLYYTVEDEVQEHLEKAKAEKVIEEVVRNALLYNYLIILSQTTCTLSLLKR